MGHASETSPAEFREVRDTTVVLLRFAAAYCLFDAMNIIFASAIKGAGDTRFVLAVTAIASPLPLVIGWIGIYYWGFGLICCWWVITGWICTPGVVYLLCFLQGSWRTMRVIESNLLDDETGDETVVPREPAVVQVTECK